MADVNLRSLFLRSRRAFLYVGLALLSCSAAAGSSQRPARGAAVAQLEDLTGGWTADDGATYYLRQIGNQVWWTGLSRDNGLSFTNVFHGSIQGNVIVGNWSDVPRGKIMSSGNLTLSLATTRGGLELYKQNQTGGFGASVWRRGARPPDSQSTENRTRTVLADGTVEVRYADGTIRRYDQGGGITTVFPDGKTQRALPANVAKLAPPLTLSDPNFSPWLEQENNRLLEIIQAMVPQSDRQAVVQNVNAAEVGKTVYQQIDFRLG